jgi:hypothetical protein
MIDGMTDGIDEGKRFQCKRYTSVNERQNKLKTNMKKWRDGKPRGVTVRKQRTDNSKK